MAPWGTVGRVWRAGTGHSELPLSPEERPTHGSWEWDVPRVKVSGAGGAPRVAAWLLFMPSGQSADRKEGSSKPRGSGGRGAGSTQEGIGRETGGAWRSVSRSEAVGARPRAVLSPEGLAPFW